MGELKIFEADLDSALELPYADEGVKAGFPSPAQDFLNERIDLNRDLINHAESTFYARVTGDSMIEANVFDGDILVIDKSLEPSDGAMAVCFLDGEFTLKFLEVRQACLYLCPANPKYPKIQVDIKESFRIWGIVTYVIHKVHR